MIDERLSPHFWLSEFLRSETAERHGIDNSPTPAVFSRLRNNAQMMEEVRGILGTPIHITSGYRCPDLERVIVGRAFYYWCARHRRSPDDPEAWVSYLEGKAHPRGDASDFQSPSFGEPLKICQAIEAETNIIFDQLIWEHSWVHIGWAKEGQHPRRQVLTLMRDGGYSFGIVQE